MNGGMVGGKTASSHLDYFLRLMDILGPFLVVHTLAGPILIKMPIISPFLFVAFTCHSYVIYGSGSDKLPRQSGPRWFDLLGTDSEQKPIACHEWNLGLRMRVYPWPGYQLLPFHQA